MAGHSHWAGIKHKKGRQDKQRANLFSKLSREITVAAKLGSKDPESNPRLRSAIQAAKQSNMPKDNINRAINKSGQSINQSFSNLRYEGFGPFNVALVIETLTDNQNRSASSIRTILNKNGGRLGESGSTVHLFDNFGIIRLKLDQISEDKIFDIAANSGAKDCVKDNDLIEIITEKENFYNVKSIIEEKVKNIYSSGIEWVPKNTVDLSVEQSKKVIEILEMLEENEDVQNTFANCKFNEN